MTELSDQSLLAHWYRHRNAEAFHVLATRHARMVYATALRVLRDVQAAEDVSQESFLALAQTKRPPSRNVAAWLHRTAYRAALDVIRSGKRRQTRDLDYAALQPQSTQTTWDDMRGLVDEAVASLPEAWREPLVRHFFEQESHAAIAAALGIPRQTVTHRIGKGIEQVRQQLKDMGVIVPAGALLATLIQENSVAALPMSAAAGIGRIALVATPSMAAVLVTYTTGAALKAAAALLVVSVGWAIFQVAGPGPGQVTDTEPLTTEESMSVAAGEIDSVQPASGNVSLPTTSSTGGTDRPTALASVAGTVTVPNGRPLSGAKVWIVVAADLATGDYRVTSTFFVDADAEGKFEQREIPPGEYGVLAREKENNLIGPDSELARITLTPGERKENLNLVFGTEGDLTVTGTVVDGQGRPLEGVRVTKFAPASRGAFTDSIGRFTIRYLPDDSVQLNVDKQGYAPGGVLARAGDQNVQVVLRQGAEVQGRVIDAKTRKPVTNYEAILKSGFSNPASLQTWEDADRFENPEGEFKFPPIFSGEITVAARAPGYALAAMHATVAEGGMLQGLVIELQADEGVIRTGRVVTAEGVPIAGVRIATGRIASPDERDRNVVATTDEAGEFSTENIPDETILLYAWHPEFAPASRLADSAEDFVLKKAGRLNVEVLSQGAPLSKVTVSAESFGERNMSYMNGIATGPDGRALLKEIIPGRVLVQAELGFLRVQQQIVIVEPGEEKTVQFDVASDAGAVEGIVYQDGEPLSAGSVQLNVNTGLGNERLLQELAPDGTFTFRNVPLGEAQVIASLGGYSQRAIVEDVLIESGKTTALTIDVTQDRTLRGTISGVNAGERASVMILRGALGYDEVVEAAAAGLYATQLAGYCYTDESGDYEAPLCEPGTYTLLVSTSPERSVQNSIHRESRVVEVVEKDDFVADFALSY